MQITVKPYDKLTLEELYAIISLRLEVFVVEQACPYQDLDGLDQVSHHVCVWGDGVLVAYARVMGEHTKFRDVSIGRIISKYRGRGLGALVVTEAQKVAVALYHPDVVRIGAQKYAKGFYEKCGFHQDSGDYLEDGIPHIEMIWRPNDTAQGKDA